MAKTDAWYPDFQYLRLKKQCDYYRAPHCMPDLSLHMYAKVKCATSRSLSEARQTHLTGPCTSGTRDG